MRNAPSRPCHGQPPQLYSRCLSLRCPGVPLGSRHQLLPALLSPSKARVHVLDLVPGFSALHLTKSAYQSIRESLTQPFGLRGSPPASCTHHSGGSWWGRARIWWGRVRSEGLPSCHSLRGLKSGDRGHNGANDRPGSFKAGVRTQVCSFLWNVDLQLL